MSKLKPIWTVSTWILKIAFALLALAIPLLGAWVGSSLAAFSNGPTWVALASALLAFPVLPLLWDFVSERRRKKRADEKKSKERILTFFDRMVVRTLSINVLFLAGLLFFGPALLFTALSSRGDWMLDGQSGQLVDTSRAQLFKTVDALEWGFEAISAANEYEEMVDKDEEGPPPDRSDSADTREPVVDSSETSNDALDTGEQEPDSPEPAGPDREWPFEDTLHPAVSQVPEDANGSIEEVARFLVSQEEDPFQRVKALHDWVANHVAYDVAFLRKLERNEPIAFGTQSAETVFRTGDGVCAGYANLLKAFGDATDIDIRVVVGDTREGGEMRSGGHAWNAVNIENRWYLMDATWDAGNVGGEEFTKAYTADFFLTPARAFIGNHFPEDPGWQLLGDPVTRGEFLRAPNMRPSFFEHGFQLRSPDRSQVTVSGDLEVQLRNPRTRSVLVDYLRKDTGTQERCTVSGGADIVATCSFPGPGIYTVLLFQNGSAYGSFESMGSIEVVRR